MMKGVDGTPYGLMHEKVVEILSASLRIYGAKPCSAEEY